MYLKSLDTDIPYRTRLIQSTVMVDLSVKRM